jgi:hypothetical protein
MIDYYVCKRGLPGVPAGAIERFHPARALPLLAAGDLVRFDPKDKDHAARLAAQERANAERRDREQKRLDAEAKIRGLHH